ncbi:MAG: L,D-transpeptidase [Candidatus Methylacidiphilales bacterium]
MRCLIYFFLSLVALGGVETGQAFEIPANCGQLITGVAKSWDDSEVLLQRWIRQEDGVWKASGTPWPGRLGSSGLAWGLGLHPADLPGIRKVEGDKRAPAGVFRLGNAYGYAPDVLRLPALPYTQITESDLWVEDVKSPYYNHHIKLEGRGPQNEWERQAQMRLNDPAHALKLFIGHNPPPHVVPGAGSAIFFHIWRRNGEAATSGCTVMDEDQLKSLIAWVNPAKNPLYVLLPESVYNQMRSAWRLP